MKITPVIAKQHYFKPGPANRLGFWKFLTYLGSRSGAGAWIDKGLGTTREDILRLTDERQSRQVQARDLVIAPDPYLWAFLPKERRHSIMTRITERSVEAWFRTNGWGEAEYSHILHDKETDGLDKLHSHVILPATIQPNPLFRPRKHFVHRVHLENLRRTASDFFIHEMERQLGREAVRTIFQERDLRIERERSLKQPKTAILPLADIGSAVSLMKQGKAVSKKAAQRQHERSLRHYGRQRLTAKREGQREQRRHARDLRLADRERVYQETLAQLRREELEQVRVALAKRSAERSAMLQNKQVLDRNRAPQDSRGREIER